MLDTEKLCCPQCKGKLRIRRQKISNIRRGKHIDQKRRCLYCPQCRAGWRIQVIDLGPRIRRRSK